MVLVKWYDYAKWVLERVEGFPKSQRFVLGQRLAGQVMGVLAGKYYRSSLLWSSVHEGAVVGPSARSEPSGLQPRAGWAEGPIAHSLGLQAQEWPKANPGL